MRQLSIFIFLQIICSCVVHAQSDIDMWKNFKREYVTDLREGKEFGEKTILFGKEITNKSTSTTDVKLVDIAMNGISPQATSYFSKLDPIKMVDSLALILAMKATYNESSFYNLYDRFYNLHKKSLIPDWYITDLIDGLPDNCLFVSSGNLETFEVKNALNKQNRTIEIVDRTEFKGKPFTNNYKEISIQKDFSLEKWLMEQNEQRVFISLLYPNDQLISLQKYTYVQGLAVEFSAKKIDNIIINQQLAVKVRFHSKIDSPLLVNYLPALYTLKKAGAKVDDYIKLIEK